MHRLDQNARSVQTWSEHSKCEDDDAHVSIPAAVDLDKTGVPIEHPAAAEADQVTISSYPEEKLTKAQIFQVTISLRDDWLHRGDALQD